MRIYNTASKETEDLMSIEEGKVKMYCCGPTVYDYPHLGNLRKYVMDDVIRRALELAGYKVQHVMNITDVGHLTDDADAGEDKLEKGAKKTGKTVWEVANYYTHEFEKAMKLMNVLTPTVTCKATEHIPQMIELIKQLGAKGYTYETPEAVYFDVTRFSRYTELSRQKLSEKMNAARSEVEEDAEKKNPADFSLWFKRIGRFADHSMHWDSPWGDGFPGWHIECSAMSMHYLGDQLDLHTGGIDHIPVHHTNEIAQSEAASGKHPFVKYWVHHNFMLIEGAKMSKSLNNFFTIDEVVGRGYHPMALRLLFLQTHYRQQMNFTWEALKGAHQTYERLQKLLSPVISRGQDRNREDIPQKFIHALSEDINTSQALATVFELIDNKEFEKAVYMLEVLGILIEPIAEVNIPEHIIDFAKQRRDAKKNKNFSLSDELRTKIETAGYDIRDLPDNEFHLEKKT